MSEHTTTHEPDDSQRPSGRDEIMAAVLDAATKLFSTRPPSAVSVRQIADEAGVQHSVVHRYFGTKEDLLQAVIREGSRRQTEAMAEVRHATPEMALEAALQQGPYFRALLLASMEGTDPRAMLDSMESTQSVFDLVASHPSPVHMQGGPRFDPRIIIVVVMATLMGWQGAESTLTYLAHLDDEDPVDVRRQMAELLDYLLRIGRPVEG